jgi:hypothetical protein
MVDIRPTMDTCTYGAKACMVDPTAGGAEVLQAELPGRSLRDETRPNAGFEGRGPARIWRVVTDASRVTGELPKPEQEGT